MPLGKESHAELCGQRRILSGPGLIGCAVAPDLRQITSDVLLESVQKWSVLMGPVGHWGGVVGKNPVEERPRQLAGGNFDLGIPFGAARVESIGEHAV